MNEQTEANLGGMVHSMQTTLQGETARIPLEIYEDKNQAVSRSSHASVIPKLAVFWALSLPVFWQLMSRPTPTGIGEMTCRLPT